MRVRLLWAAVTAAWLGVEAEGVHRKSNADWPTFSYFLREARGSKHLPPYWMMLGFWAWLGYHVFLTENP